MNRAQKSSLKEYDEWCGQLAERINRDVQPFSDMSTAAKIERKKRAEHDYLYALQTYFPHYFSDEFSQDHPRLLKSYQTKNEIQFWNCYRGFGKSTHARALLVLDMLYKRTHFAAYCSYNQDKAAMHLAAPRVELEINPRIKHDFGINVEGDMYFWRTSHGNAVSSYGRMMNFKGDTFNQYRPDLWFWDDWDSDEHSNNPDIAERGMNWIIEQAIPGSAPKWRAFYLSTPPTGRHSVYKRLKKNPGVKVVEIPAEKKVGIARRRVATWPQRHPLSWLDGIKKLIGRTAYDRNFLLKEISKDSPFKEDDFCYYGKKSQAINISGMYRVGYIDPSVKDTLKHDGKALVTVIQSITRGGPVFVHDSWSAHCSVERLINTLYERDKLFHYDIVGVEENAMPLLVNEIRHYEKIYDRVLPLRSFRVTENKKSRIITLLEGPVQRGELMFAEDQEQLKDQLIDIENNSVHDDEADALHGAYKVLLRKAFGRIDEVTIL